MEQFLITLQGEKERLTGRKGQSVLSVLREYGYDLDAPCGGQGSCGKCRVVSKEGEEFLACQWYPSADIELQWKGKEQKFAILANEKVVRKSETSASCSLGIAIDLGTTTLAAALVALETGEEIGEAVALNRQRIFGSDVIHRIQASNEGQGEVLRRYITEDICSLVENLLKKAPDRGKLKKIVISGNTTMLHLLQGYSCEGLGGFPFQAVSLSLRRAEFEEIFGAKRLPGLQCEVVMLPGISAFVGADLVCGVMECAMKRQDAVSLLIDLGTNGEMALGNKNRLLTASVAAGPAFEGGNLSCGTGSIPGAICDVRIEGKRILVETIAGEAPTGICGTGAIAALSELYCAGRIDATGTLGWEEERGVLLRMTREGKKLLLTQGDIRELQMAKAAIRAGIEILLKEYGITPKQVERVYLAGGFGFSLDVEKAAKIGIFPGEWKEKVEIVGNTSLKGAISALTKEQAVIDLEEIAGYAEEIVLANDGEFERRYVESMNLPVL